MKLPLFQLEDYLSTREFRARYLFCASDIQPWTQAEILALADAEMLQCWEQLSLGYTHTKGDPLLLHEISQQYQKINDEKIHTFAGAEEALFCCIQSILQTGDHAIVVTPCYQSLLAVTAQIAAVTTVPLRAEEDWKLDLEKIVDAITPQTKLIIINFPHNPTGSLIDQVTQQQLIELARAQEIVILSDEVYRFMEIDPQQRLPAIADVYEHGISVNVMTKAYGLAGLRIGWIATQNSQLLSSIAELKHYLSICNSAPSEILALMALRAKDTILAKNHRLLVHNFQKMESFFQKHADGIEWQAPQGGCCGLARIKGGRVVDELAESLLAEHGVLILPGRVFGLTDFFRVGFGRTNLSECLEQLSRFLEKNRF